MKKYQYQLIRYVHDHFTGEYVNVGVVVYSKEHRFLASKTTSRYKRITGMFPEANGSWIVRILNNFDRHISKVSGELSELFEPSEQLDHITSSILTKDNSAIQLSEIRMAIDVDLDCAIEDLYQSQVEKYMLHKENVGSMQDEEVWQIKYKTYFEKYGINKRLQTHQVKVPEDVISFDMSWKNEVWHSYEPLSFVLKEDDSIKNKVYKWSGILQALKRTNERLHLTLLTSISDRHKDLMSFVNENLKVDTEQLKVDIITDDKAEGLAQEISRAMEMHDTEN